MTAAAKNVSLAVAPFTKFAVRVINGDIVYAGAYVMAGNRDHGTAGSRGLGIPAAPSVNGTLPLGFADQQITGDTSAAVPPEASINIEGKVVRGLTITDDAGDISDTFRTVYVTDDQTFTLTRPSEPAIPVGFTVRFLAADTFDVYFFSMGELAVLMLAGGNLRTWYLGSIEASGASGDALTGIVSPFAGRITSVYGIVEEAIADADADYDINLEIDGTNVTGGVIEWVTADVIADKKAGTAITAANVLHIGSLVDVEKVQNTAGTVGDGRMGIYATVVLDLGV